MPNRPFQQGRGIWINRDGFTNLERLFAAGEDSSGVHGANRLGGNGVAESTVYGAPQQALDLRNLLTASELMARSALMREDSRGAHYREDFPYTDNPKWLKNIYLAYNEFELRLWIEPVRLDRLKP